MPDLVASTTRDPESVDALSQAYIDMSAKWSLVHDLYGGTESMRAAGERWLPREPREQDSKYILRLNRSFLFPAFHDTIGQLVAKPFSREITISGELPESIEKLPNDVDREGTDITQFGAKVFESALKYGLCHILVDYPRVGSMNLAEERQAGVRPMFVMVEAPELIGWRFKRTDNGSRKLTQIRIFERRTIDEGSYGDTYKEYIRVYTESTWELWGNSTNEKGEKSWLKEDEGTHSYPGIPLVTYYVNKTGYMQGNTPLEDLAWLNVAHWQSMSDQRNILRFARTGLLFAKGFRDDELSDLVLGPNSYVKTSNDQAEIKWVEHTGTAIKSGEDDLSKLEERMEVLGMQPLIQRTSRSTATGKVIDQNKVDSTCQRWIRGLESSLYDCLSVGARWVGAELPEDVEVDIFNDFGITLGRADDIKHLREMARENLITKELALREIKRRSLISETTDIEEELAKLEAQNGDGLGDLPDILRGDDDDEGDQGGRGGTGSGTGGTDGTTGDGSSGDDIE